MTKIYLFICICPGRKNIMNEVLVDLFAAKGKKRSHSANRAPERTAITAKQT